MKTARLWAFPIIALLIVLLAGGRALIGDQADEVEERCIIFQSGEIGEVDYEEIDVAGYSEIMFPKPYHDDVVLVQIYSDAPCPPSLQKVNAEGFKYRSYCCFMDEQPDKEMIWTCNHYGNFRWVSVGK